MVMKKLGVSESFDKGYQAQSEGQHLEDNPYPSEDLDRQNWEAGHKEAADDVKSDTEAKPEL